MCSSRKCPCPPQGRLTEIARGRGVSKALFFEGKYDTKMEFPERWEGEGGFNLKNLPWEGYGYFLEQHNFETWGVVPSFDLGMFSHVMCLEQ